MDSDDASRGVDLVADAQELGLQLSESIYCRLFDTLMAQAEFAYTGVCLELHG